MHSLASVTPMLAAAKGAAQEATWPIVHERVGPGADACADAASR